jgi:hypothetical protein
MKNFKDFGIKPTQPGLVGDKIKIDRILNREIVVHDFRIVPSKYADKGNGRCLHLGIMLGDTKHVVFTGSAGLMDTIEQVPKSDFPFTTTIVKDNDRFEFS